MCVCVCVCAIFQTVLSVSFKTSVITNTCSAHPFNQSGHSITAAPASSSSISWKMWWTSSVHVEERLNPWLCSCYYTADKGHDPHLSSQSPSFRQLSRKKDQTSLFCQLAVLQLHQKEMFHPFAKTSSVNSKNLVTLYLFTDLNPYCVQFKKRCVKIHCISNVRCHLSCTSHHWSQNKWMNIENYISIFSINRKIPFTIFVFHRGMK